ncbi:DUF3658 domain-containing protein [Ideonella sp. DXS29W]|uniref:DUF3658 domain-containing protein n=1 Tax=Ideonella lacteola TaxID=2984193 RepID=A0ABU9BYC2_9BURK
MQIDEDPQGEEPTPDEIALIRSVSPEDEAWVDQLLLRICTPQWRKVAMVVAKASREFDARFEELPYVYLPLRLGALAERGVVEARGRIFFMRHSEVRLVQGEANGAA